MEEKIRNISNLRITAENDSFELFEEYENLKKRKKIKQIIAISSSVAALLLLLLVIRSMGQGSIVDIYDNSLGLCGRSFSELKEKGYKFRELSQTDDCLNDCSFCESGKWFMVSNIKGIILQKAVADDEIVRIRFTRDYKGTLPNVKGADLDRIHQIKDLSGLHQMWYAEHCSDYTSFSQGDFRILVKSKNTIESGLIDVGDSEFSDMPIEYLEIFNSCLNN